MTLPLTFRIAAEDDVPAVVALVESAYRGEASKAGWTTEADLLDGRRTDAAAVAEIIAAEHRVLLLAEAAGELAGCCQLQRRPPAQAYFGLFAVWPKAQGRGTGRRILAEAERRVQADWHAEQMIMTVLAPRQDLIAWYRRCGYELTGATSPFPYDNKRFGIPRRPDLHFVELAKDLGGA